MADPPHTGQVCLDGVTDPGEYRALAEITVGDGRGTFVSGDILTVEGGPATSPAPSTRLKEIPDSLGMRFVRISGGESPIGAAGVRTESSELLVKRVRTDAAFWMDKDDATPGQWQAVMGRNLLTIANRDADCPVGSVLRNDWQNCVARLNEPDEDRQYRLATEAECEHAAKAGLGTDTLAGDLTILGKYDAPLQDGVGWNGGNSGVDYEGGWARSGFPGTRQYPSSRAGPDPVGQRALNEFALHHVLANADAWVPNCHGDSSSSGSAGPRRSPRRVAASAAVGLSGGADLDREESLGRIVRFSVPDSLL